MSPINLSTQTAGTAITVGQGPYDCGCFSPDGKTAYATNSADGTVTPIDVATSAAGTPIPGTPVGRSLAITPDQAPVANFAVASAAPGSATSFDASSSTVRFGSIVKYVWDFGDGTPVVTTSAPTTSHVYASANTYTATVTETDNAGTSTSRVFHGSDGESERGSER